MPRYPLFRAYPFPAALVLVAVIAVVDHATGISIRIYPLYFAPIALAAWFGRPSYGLWLPAICTATWLLANLSGFQPDWQPWIWVINTLTQGFAFAIVGWLIRTLRGRLRLEQSLSLTDMLTGLANKRAFIESGNRMLANAVRQEQPVAVAFIDLDNFKNVNDSRGHAEGDLVLQAVSASLRGALRAGDLLARLGGDEFVMVLANADGKHVAQLLGRIRDRTNQCMQQHAWPVTLSIGAVVYQVAPPDLQDAVQRADGLMYAAKRGGKDRVHVEYLGAGESYIRALRATPELQSSGHG